MLNLANFNPAQPYYMTRGGSIAKVGCVDNSQKNEVRPSYKAIGWASDGTVRSWGLDGIWSATGVASHGDLVKHLPDCTGFDWQPPIELNESNWNSYVGKTVEVGDGIQFVKRTLVTYYNGLFYAYGTGERGFLYGWKKARTC